MGNSMAKQQQQQGLGLHKFRLLRVIGRGSFGKVRIVEHRDSGKTYALKYINKATCIAMKAHQNTIRERDMLEEIDHPFIVNLRFSFQDEFSMYVVMDLMIGGDLRFHMMRRRFVEGVIRFWIAEVACAVHHLHTNHRIVHRDIKPDNILIDEYGHAALTDFNIATRIKGTTPHYSVAGTANYMAPEVVSGVGYTYSVDWWSLGVVMYECIYGKRPFHNKKRNDDLKRALLYEEIQFPIIADVQVSYDCISAMRGFLNKDPSQRLGCGPGGMEAVKSHPFFASINWDLLEAKQLEPPFAPNSDQSNFDISHDLEEMLLEPEPLDPKKRAAMKKHKTPPEHDTKEYRDIQEKFSAFDYIEYERFKCYIDAHGSVDSLAVDAARATASVQRRSSASNENTAAPPSLVQLRLNGSPLINLDPKAVAAAAALLPSPVSSISRSRNSTTHMIASPPRRDSKENANQLAHSPSALRAQSTVHSDSSISLAAIGASNTNTNSNSNANFAATPTIQASTSAALLAAMSTTSEPSIVEPPSIVPIDTMTWNQLLPEQRSLAHRYCVKMAHDRRRRVSISERKARNLSATASSNTASPKIHAVASSPAVATHHRNSPSTSSARMTQHSRVGSTAAQPSVDERPDQQASKTNYAKPPVSSNYTPKPTTTTGLKEDVPNSSLLTAKEKRKSLMKRQLSADNLSQIAPSVPSNPIISPATAQRIPNSYKMHSAQQQRQLQQLEMSFTDLPTTAMRILPSPFAMNGSNSNLAVSNQISQASYTSLIGQADQSELYLHQPLPPPPPLEVTDAPLLPLAPLPPLPTLSSIPSIDMPLMPVSAKISHKLNIPAHLLDMPVCTASPSSSITSQSPSSSPLLSHVI
ncbi:hypothetical protein GGI07_002458 [Coemansia sp. Benny D115]|nr:hypothetical protein GGI07_002458 [Coemansia sp. Benny D115]